MHANIDIGLEHEPYMWIDIILYKLIVKYRYKIDKVKLKLNWQLSTILSQSDGEVHSL